jgi:hypothetical protein
MKDCEVSAMFYLPTISTRKVLYRHRLPKRYRALLPALVLTPAPIFILAILIGRGWHNALLDPRFWLPLCIALLPAVYWWREGVDVRVNGIVRRIHVPRFYPYTDLASYYHAADKGLFIIYDNDGETALECRPAHLTDFPVFLETCRTHLPRRLWRR